ncbi:adenylate/guanylate cyclase domain-containing protein [Novosphingobium album (ex Liu et al. 2023)]|uniref:Adenylate/guanylate cyclase domain-containing protein n=1 Tax=Novosphingobium album (ex Liu et al. 2023) TaxID=3031130 RepID=A0ABT5WNP1_9SPHN|nr:adenylate/guanylate cyclase domain-containing protein [Novosphingobium album (ex Liu et al. 2023)]MDE8651664.1 adenylate/guanylate cyclase domain-containing protein [Novosphingobium album (ex Liu et al. 2023)]
MDHAFREAEATGRELLQKGWRSVRAASRQRFAVMVLLLILALAIARFSWSLPVIGDAERSLYDLRTYVNAPQVDQDQRIQIIAYDDQTLIAARKRSPLDRGLLARALRNIDGMGARAIGIDILFDQPQDEDADLIAALRAMKTPTFVAYAEQETNATSIEFEQQTFLKSFVARLAGSNAHPASVRFDNEDGVTRSWPEIVPGLPPLLGRAMVAAAGTGEDRAFAGYVGPVRYRLPKFADRPVYSTLRIDLFADPAMAPALASQVAGRYVLIGGDIVDIDRLNTALTSVDAETPPGIVGHAEMIAQMLDGARYTSVFGWQRWVMALAIVLSAALTSLLEARVWRAVPFLLAQLTLIGGLPFALQKWGINTIGTPAVGWAIGWVLAFLAVSSTVRASTAVERQFAQTALGKYLPADIAQEIIDNPERLSLTGAKRELYILFSDLEGFTKLSHQLEPETVARLLNDYLDRLSAVVLEHGGLIDKYVGDAVVAFWGAPIARPDDARKAALAGYAMWRAGEEFRKGVDPALPPIGKTRVGMHFGEAVVGNFGGERRIQYTALGDAMNTAARLEAANKLLGSAMMASRELAERSGLDWWRPMGRVILRGRSRPIELFEPAPHFPREDRDRLAEAMRLIDTGAAPDRLRAIAIVRKLTDTHAGDVALANLLRRIEELGDAHAYVLG